MVQINKNMGRKKHKKAGKRNKEKKVHVNKYSSAQRGPKIKPGNKPSHLEETVDKEFPQVNQQQTRREVNIDSEKGHECLNSQAVRSTSGYDIKRNFRYNSETVDLLLFDPKTKYCLLVGSWGKIEDFEKEMQKVRKATGSSIETSWNKDLGIYTALVYSSDPNDFRTALELDKVKVITKLPRGDFGDSLLIHHQNPKLRKGKELTQIIKHYLNETSRKYFHDDNWLKTF
jgi:hypothetical protein